MSARRTTAERLACAEASLGLLEEQAMAAVERAAAVTPGGLADYDSAILSGIRRKPNPKADARRYAAYDREARLSAEAMKVREEVLALRRQLSAEEAEATVKAKLTVAEVRAARFVRDRYGWHKVVRVSAKSVTVETGYSWTDRITLDRVIEVRP